MDWRKTVLNADVKPVESSALAGAWAGGKPTVKTPQQPKFFYSREFMISLFKVDAEPPSGFEIPESLISLKAKTMIENVSLDKAIYTIVSTGTKPFVARGEFKPKMPMKPSRDLHTESTQDTWDTPTGVGSFGNDGAFSMNSSNPQGLTTTQKLNAHPAIPKLEQVEQEKIIRNSPDLQKQNILNKDPIPKERAFQLESNHSNEEKNYALSRFSNSRPLELYYSRTYLTTKISAAKTSGIVFRIQAKSGPIIGSLL